MDRICPRIDTQCSVSFSPNSPYSRTLARAIQENSHDFYSLYSCVPPTFGFQHKVPASRIFGVSEQHFSRPTAPERVLDAPGLIDDFYLKLVDWGNNNHLAVALRNSIYLWNSQTGDVLELATLSPQVYASSLSWSTSGTIAIGVSDGSVQLWDVHRQMLLRTLDEGKETSQGQESPLRVSSLAWNHNVLTLGNRRGTIFHTDTRSETWIQISRDAHRNEVCGLAWSPDGVLLGSGGNDNIVHIWDRCQSRTPLHKKTDHKAAIKALAWCPWKSRLLATGGGSADKTIKTWNAVMGTCLASVDTGSQITALLWSPSEYKQLLSSHGYVDNKIVVWSHSKMKKIAEIGSHSARILHMVSSPDRRTVVSVGADECLNFWSVYPFSKHGELTSLLGSPPSPRAHSQIQPICSPICGKNF